MNCEHCGAAMTLIQDQGYFFCEYCGYFHFPEASKEVVEVLVDGVEDLKCPACQDSLFRATIDGFPGWRCKRCKGLLIYQGTLWEIIRHRRARAADPPDPPRKLNVEELEREIICPCCGKKMETHPYQGPGFIVIESCRFCKVVWLDFGEFGRAINAPGPDRGWW